VGRDDRPEHDRGDAERRQARAGAEHQADGAQRLGEDDQERERAGRCIVPVKNPIVPENP
jgi:hypothetical protein